MIVDRIKDLLNLWIDAEAFELGPEIEFDDDVEHPFDAVDSDHPDETDGSLEEWVRIECRRGVMICLRCGNPSPSCVC